MSLLLNGHPVPGFDHRVTVQEQIERKDLSGETSATAGAHAGWKPAVISVQVTVRQDEPEQLAALRGLWHVAQPETGAPFAWDVTHLLLNALAIKKAQFTDFFKVSERDAEKLWDAQVTLVEVRSVPEKTEERLPESPAASVPQPEGTSTTGAASPSGFEALLAKVDALIGKHVFGEQ